MAREYQITENTISKWRRQHRQYQDRAFAGRAMPIRMRRGFTNSRMVGRLTMRERLFKKALAETGKRELSSAPATPAVVYGRATPTSGRETDRRAEPYQARRGGRSLSLSLSRPSGVSYASPAPLATMSWSCARRFKPSLLRCVLTVIVQSPQNCTVVAAKSIASAFCGCCAKTYGTA